MHLENMYTLNIFCLKYHL